jgi:hypothetical protein
LAVFAALALRADDSKTYSTIASNNLMTGAVATALVINLPAPGGNIVIDLRTGKVDIGMAKLDAAALAFWREIAKAFPNARDAIIGDLQPYRGTSIEYAKGANDALDTLAHFELERRVQIWSAGEKNDLKAASLIMPMTIGEEAEVICSRLGIDRRKR